MDDGVTKADGNVEIEINVNPVDESRSRCKNLRDELYKLL